MKLRVACAATLLALAPAVSHAQQWHGSFALGWAWLNTTGNSGSFHSQYNLDDGFFLEGLDLGWDGAAGARVRLTARGWGEADPVATANLVLEGNGPWEAEIGYQRRESFFSLAASELGARSDDWQITRWKGRFAWNGWDFASLALELNRTERSGVLQRAWYGLNELYTAAADLDETRDEATLRLVTKELPVHIELEQSFASYERRNRLRPGDAASPGGDPDLLDALATDFEDSQDVPTTRVAATWRGGALEVAGSLLWSSADLDRTGAGWSRFLVGGGAIGTVEFVDTLASSASMDTLAGTVRVAADLGKGWRLTLDGSTADTQTDAGLLGERLVRITNPLGEQFDLPGSLSETGILDRTDTRLRATAEHRLGRLTYWLGGFAGSRDVTWRREEEGPVTDVTRDTAGGLFGISYRTGKSTWLSAEYEHGDFDRFVFRTDPETVDRLTLKARGALGHGWSGSLFTRLEQADNPSSEGGLSHSATAVGASAAWSDAEGARAAGIDVSVNSVTTDTGLLLPDGAAGTSRYDLGLLTLTAYGSTNLGPVALRASATRITDSGDTWPADSWNLSLRAGIEVFANARLSGFLQYWKYDEERADADDFTATRYGAVLSWSF